MRISVIDRLDSLGVEYVLKQHKHEALTCEKAAEERGCRVSQIVKTMVTKDQEGGYHVCLIPGHKTLKIKKVRKEAGGIKLDLVDPVEISQELNLIVGAISPLVFPEGTKFYVDPTVLDEKEIDISSGDPKSGLELSSKDLVRIVDGKLCDIISSNS